MARMGFIDRDGMRHLLIIPVTGVETDAVFTLLHADKYPLSIKGEIVFTGDSAPQIILFGNNVAVKKKSSGETCEWRPCCGVLGMCDTSCGQLAEISRDNTGPITKDELLKFEGEECPDCHKKIRVFI